MRAIIGRVAAVLIGGLVAWLAGSFGLEVSEEATVALTEGLTMLGMGVWLISYGIAHKLINRKVNPADAARVP